MIATAIFGEDGGVYDQSLILNEGFDIDRGLLGVVGLPKLATSALWTSVTANIAVRLLSISLYRAAYLDDGSAAWKLDHVRCALPGVESILALRILQIQ
jgi:hypothetical protein